MDREKVISTLEEIKTQTAEIGLDSAVIAHKFIDEIIALLKEQDAVEPFHKCIDKDFTLIEDSHFDYCPYCGKPITWAKQEGR